MEIITNTTKYGQMSYLKNDIYFSDTLSRNEIHEQEIIEKYLSEIVKDSKVILDIGAHCGSHSIIYSKLNPNCKIYSFEPQKAMYELLNKNIQDNHITNIETFNVALGNKKCHFTMSSNCSHGPNMNVNINQTMQFNLGSLQIGKGGETIEINRLDDYDFGSVDYIKIDTEGFEPFIIDGGMELIKKYKPFLFLELNRSPITEDMKDSYLPVNKNIIITLIDLGYRKHLIDDYDNFLCFNRHNQKHISHMMNFKL